MLKSLHNRILNWFGRRKSLRDRCVDAYGEMFGELYDRIASGEPALGLEGTMLFVDMLTAVRDGRDDQVEMFKNPEYLVYLVSK